MKRKISRESVLKKLEQLAFGRANDAVKLALADAETVQADTDSLDLTLLSEVRRGANGGIEIRLVDRLAVIRLLLETLGDGGETEAERFLAVLAQAGTAPGGSDAL